MIGARASYLLNYRLGSRPRLVSARRGWVHVDATIATVKSNAEDRHDHPREHLISTLLQSVTPPRNTITR